LIQVIDTGPGISHGDLGSIFEEFHQLKQTGQSEAPGVGLGLAIVKRIAEMLDVKIDVRSTLGSGSIFAVEVPISGRNTPSLVASKQSSPSIEMPLHGASVMVVDNEIMIREGMCDLLETWGCQVYAASELEDVKQLVKKHELLPDFMIVDFHLDNQITGLDILAYLDNEMGICVPSIVVTADRSDEMRNQVLKAGYRLLNKPLKPHRLRAWMAHSLKEHALE